MWDDWRKRREGNRATQKCRTVAAVRVTRSLSPTHCLTMKSGDLWHAKCQVSNVVCYISMLMTVRCVYFLPLDAVPSAVTQLSSCLADVAAWLSASRLRLNPSKTVVIWLGSKYQVAPVLTSTVPQRVPLVSFMAAHVGSVFRSAYYQLRQLRPAMRSLSLDAAKMLAQDYCNSTLYDITDSLFRRLQGVQNATARIITGV